MGSNMKNIPSVATLLLVFTACSYTPVSPTAGGQTGASGGQTGASGSPTVASLSPSSGPVGTAVVIRGTGFSTNGNTIAFATMVLEDPRGMPNEPSVIPDRPSADGSAVTFDVLSVWRPACSYAPQGPCPFARIPTAPGTYNVSVTNAAGTSNVVTFSVTR